MNELLKEVEFLKDLNVNVIEMRKRLDTISESLYEKSQQKIREVEKYDKEMIND